MADDSADLVIGGKSRRVAMDMMKLEPKVGAGGSKPPGRQTEIEGEVHDQEDLNGIEAVLKIDGTGEFKIRFFSPTRFRGEFVAPWSNETFRGTEISVKPWQQHLSAMIQSSSRRTFLRGAAAASIASLGTASSRSQTFDLEATVIPPRQDYVDLSQIHGQPRRVSTLPRGKNGPSA